MNKVNLGDKYTHRVTLRLSDIQYDFVIKASQILGVSPSDYIRMVLNSGAVSMSQTIDNAINGVVGSRIGEVGTNENVKTDSNNLV